MANPVPASVPAQSPGPGKAPLALGRGAPQPPKPPRAGAATSTPVAAAPPVPAATPVQSPVSAAPVVPFLPAEPAATPALLTSSQWLHAAVQPPTSPPLAMPRQPQQTTLYPQQPMPIPLPPLPRFSLAPIHRLFSHSPTLNVTRTELLRPPTTQGTPPMPVREPKGATNFHSRGQKTYDMTVTSAPVSSIPLMVINFSSQVN
ncbi:uncharacterized protein LOC132341419 [Haemorhous mexicanus]|uniref:uncharacterized protein LOC132341419 n=1 Tax=Haemorhous mexicanus TaxID=30427 RepID=UPI0028BE2A39|nr:uncharacterized protein LOC132341419 [Haemorhous mexicanus]